MLEVLVHAAAFTMAAFQPEAKKVACKLFIQYVKCFVYPKIFLLQEILKQDLDFSIYAVKNCNSYSYCQKLSPLRLYSYKKTILLKQNYKQKAKCNALNNMLKRVVTARVRTSRG